MPGRWRTAIQSLFGRRTAFAPDESGKLYCLDAATGKQLWRFPYGLEGRGAPVLADGKLFIGAVNATFHILKLTDKKPEVLHTQTFESKEGVDVEINGSPAV